MLRIIAKLKPYKIAGDKERRILYLYGSYLYFWQFSPGRTREQVGTMTVERILTIFRRHEIAPPAVIIFGTHGAGAAVFSAVKNDRT